MKAKPIPEMMIMTGLCLVFLLSVLPSTGLSSFPLRQTVTVTDAVNRTVSFELPLTRIVTINTASAIILRALGVDLPKTVVGMTTYMTDNIRFWPGLEGKPDFKFTQLSYERLAELNPDLIILYKNSYLTADENKLRSLNIPFLYMDCNDVRTLDRDIRQLARLFGKLDRAEALITWYGRYQALIMERIKKIPLNERPTVFYYSFVHSNLAKGIYSTKNKQSSGHALIERAGGLSLSADLAEESLKVSGEWLLERQPQVIIGDVVSRGLSGYNADVKSARAGMKGLWDTLAADSTLSRTPAIRSGRVLLISQDLKEGPGAVIGMAVIAKFLFPERFRDLDPMAMLEEYHETWCKLPTRGVFAYPSLPLTVTDSCGRTITVPRPLERIACMHTSSCRELCMLQCENNVAGITGYMKQDPGLYPRLSGKADVGSVYVPNFEVLVQIRPQLVLTGTARLNLEALTGKFGPLGIPVAAFDFQPRQGDTARQREDAYDRELTILGRITGREERARDFIAWKNNILDMIESRTKGVDPVRVLGINSVSKILSGDGFAFWSGRRIIELAGGSDLTAGIKGTEISGEWILQQDPDVILISSYWPQEGLGYAVSDMEAAGKSLEKVLENPVIARSRAAGNHAVYLFGYYGTASGGQTPLGALYTAKRLYPERFRDVNPEDYHKTYLETWLDVEPRGVWFYP